MPDTIQDLLVNNGFTIDQENECFRKWTNGWQLAVIPFTDLAGHTVETFTALGKEKGWFIGQLTTQVEQPASSSPVALSELKTNFETTREPSPHPMTISYQDRPYWCRHVEVFLDGMPQKFVREANEEDGWVEVLCLNSEGNFYLIPDKKSPATERLHGHVEIRLKPLVPDPIRRLYEAKRAGR